jgi:hypothetical protein
VRAAAERENHWLAVNLPDRNTPWYGEAIVAAEVRRGRHSPHESIGHAHARVGHDQLTNSVPVAPVEAFHV